MSVPIYAHSANKFGRWHPLKDHLSAVAKLAEAHAGVAPWAAEAKLTGLLHDLGKYADRFQDHIVDYASPQNLDTPLKWIDPPHPM